MLRPSFFSVPPLLRGEGRAESSPLQELRDRADQRILLRVHHHVPRVLDQLELAVLDPAGERLRVGRRDQLVVVAPQQQRWRRDSVGALLESAIRNRPQEFARRRKPFHPLDVHRLEYFEVGRNRGHHLRRRRVGIVNSSGAICVRSVANRSAIGCSSIQNPAGAISTSFFARCTSNAATSAASIPPIECPTMCAVGIPSSSISSWKKQTASPISSICSLPVESP